MAKNPFGKTRKVDNPYAVYRDDRMGFEYRVLKTNQTPEREKTNPYASWELATKSPHTFGSWEYGAGYIKDTLHGGTYLDEAASDPLWNHVYGGANK